MLYTDPITNDLGDDYTQVYEFPAQDPAFETRAFHWGGLTSGSPITATSAISDIAAASGSVTCST